MKRALLFLAVAALWNETHLFAQATITLDTKDPRQDADITEREWGARLRNFKSPESGKEIYVGSGTLDFAGNRKEADLVWNNPPALNSFSLTYAAAIPPALARITMNASGSTSAGQFYDLQTQVNQPFSDVLIEIKSPAGNPQIIITNLVLTITGGPTTSLGNVVPPQAGKIWALISNIPNAYALGFTLTGNLTVDAALGGSDENPVINFVPLFDRSQPFSDLSLTKSHPGNFTQGQVGATYTITASNTGVGPTTGTVTVVDNFPPDLIPTAVSGSGWTCGISANSATCTRSDALAPAASYPPITLTVTVSPSAATPLNNAAVVTGGNDGNSANNTILDPTTILRGPDLAIVKTANGSFTQGQSGAGYTLTVTNTGGVATSGIITVTDNLPNGLSPAGFSAPGGSCIPSASSVTCTRSDSLAPGASWQITLTVSVASDAPLSVTNVATVGGGGDLNAGNNTATLVTSIARAPDLTITKGHSGNFTQGQTATYTITVSNIAGTATTSGTVVVTDPMPAPLTPGTGSGSGWNCVTLIGLIRCETSAIRAPGQSYPPITVTASIATDAPPTILNMATVDGGGDANAANNSASDTATVVPAADLRITKSHTGNFTQGLPGTYTITVRNGGGSETNGEVTVIDTLPGGLVPTAVSGTGWNCAPPSGQGVNCTRSDPLLTGQDYPAITITVNVQPNAPASVTNTAQVFGGGDVNSTNNQAHDPTNITAGPNLSITKSHTGNFTQGQTGTYTLTVSNTGASPTSSTIVVTDSLPTGLTSTAATGTGWACAPGGQSFSCTRSDPLAPGASSQITLTVQVAADAPASATNTAMVAGGGDVDSTNNSASDPTTIIAVPDLTITKTHTASFVQGQVGATYTLTVTNTGGGPTTGVVTVTDNVPAGLTPTAAAGAGWVCNIAGQAVSCTRSDALTVGASYPITLTVNVAAAAPPMTVNTATVSGGGEINTGNSTANDFTTIGPGPDLTITKSHTGNFFLGQTGAVYTITVSNPGLAPTSGVVVVADIVPAGLSATSASGTGWICSIVADRRDCRRNDSLAAGASYDPITLTVNVLADAPASVTNEASVFNQGDVNFNNNSDTDVTTIVPGADLTLTKSHTGNFTQGQTGATYTVTVRNSGVGPTTAPVTVTDTFPLGLNPTAAVGDGWSCTAGPQGIGCTRNDPLAAGASYPPITITLTVASDAAATVTNVAGVSGGGDSNSANNTASDATTIMAGADLTVTKTHTGNFTQGQTGATYTLTVGNSGGVPTSGLVTAIDLVPTGLTPSAASGTGWTCDIIGQAVTCGRSDPLSPGGSYPPITVTVDVASNAPASITNSARVTGGGDVNPGNNTIDDVTTNTPGPDLTLTKTHTGNFTQGQTGATFTLTVSNQGAAATSRPVFVNDAMTLPFLPTAASGTGWTCEVLAESVQCQRSDALAAGASYPPITITVNIAATAPASATNTASVLGGGDVNTGNNTASDQTTIAPGPDLTVTKTHTAAFTQGQRSATPALDYTVTVRNIGASPTTGTVTLIDSVPTGLIPLSAAGTGWTCTLSTQSVTCTRADALAAAASYPPVTLTVDVESDAPESVTNTVTISGGGDINSSNNTATDPTQIDRGQNLSISKSHTGNFTQGQSGATYTITVSNTGAVPTIGTITLIDTVPTGLFPTAASGTGWTCTVSGQTVNCTRGDPLAGGASYAPVTVTVDVADNAPASVTNRAIIAGGGDVLPINNVVDDVTAVTTGPDLTITKTHPNSFGPGQTGVIFILTVTNRGGSPTQGRVDVVDDLPLGLLTAKTASGGGWTCEVTVDTVACTRTDALAPGASYPAITLTADVAADLAIGSTLTNRATVSRGGDVNPGNNTAEDSEVLGLHPDLRISKTHSGNFTQGQTGATYTITVSNAGQQATSGEVRVQDRLPTGLTPTSATGSGWTCTISGQTVTCTRSDILAKGGSYPSITLAVKVAPDAPPSVTNTVTVSGGGDDGSDTASDVTTIQAGGPYTFAHVPVGGGYTTDFLISNTGAAGAATELILTDQAGNPFPVLLVDPSTGATLAMGSTFPVSIASAGTRIFRAAPVNPADPVKIGWGRLVPSVDHVGGVASFDYLQQTILQSTAGVFGGYPINMATMPVDNDDTQNRFTGFAVANPSNENVNVTLYVLDENGGITDVLSPPELNPLGPLKQTAKFLHEYVPTKLKFKGSMVLVGQGGKTFAVVALVRG